MDEDFSFLPSLLSVSPIFPHSVISRTWAGEEGWSRSRSVGQVDVFPRCEKEGTRKETARKRGGERASFVFLSSLHSKQFNRHRAAKCYVAAVSRRLGWIESLKNEIYVRTTKPAKMYVLESDRGRQSYQGGKNLHSLTFSHEMTYRARTRSVCSVCLRETVNGSKGVAVGGAGHDMVPCPPHEPT